MKKLERPQFLSKMFTWIIATFGFFFAIITFIISGFEINILYKIIIILLTLLILMIIYLIIFTLKLNNYCVKAEEKIIELEETKKTLVNENKEKTAIIFGITSLMRESFDTIDDFVNIVETGLVNIKGEDENILKKIYNIFMIKKEKINEKKGKYNI